MPWLKIKYFVELCFAEKKIEEADENAKVMFFLFFFFISFMDEPLEALFVLVN
jgi:hypothetical protein